MHADNDNHTLGSVGNGLRHDKHEALLLDLWVVLLASLVKHHEQADAQDEGDDDQLDDTGRS